MELKKEELLKKLLNEQKGYVGQKKDINEEEVRLMNSFKEEKVLNELSFIGEYKINTDNKTCRDTLQKMNGEEELLK